MASADILRADHSPLPWEADRSSISGGIMNVASPSDHNRTVVLTGFSVSCGVPTEKALANTEFVFRACNAHYQILEALKALVALPEGEKQLGYLRSGIGTATPNRAWLDAVAAIAAGEAEAGR